MNSKAPDKPDLSIIINKLKDAIRVRRGGGEDMNKIADRLLEIIRADHVTVMMAPEEITVKTRDDSATIDPRNPQWVWVDPSDDTTFMRNADYFKDNLLPGIIGALNQRCADDLKNHGNAPDLRLEYDPAGEHAGRGIGQFPVSEDKEHVVSHEGQAAKDKEPAKVVERVFIVDSDTTPDHPRLELSCGTRLPAAAKDVGQADSLPKKPRNAIGSWVSGLFTSTPSSPLAGRQDTAAR